MSIIVSPAFPQDKSDIRPETTEKTAFSFPEFKDELLENGFGVFFIEDNRQPVIALRFLVAISADPGRNNRVTASVVAKMLEKSLSPKGRDDIAKLLGRTGAIINIDANNEYMTINCLVLSKYSDDIIKLMAGILTNPEFNRNDIPKVVSVVEASKSALLSDPEALNEALANRVLLGVRESGEADGETLRAITENDLKDFCRKHFTPRNVTLAVVGNFKQDEVMAMLRNHLKNWKNGKEALELKYNFTPQPPGIYFIPRPGAVQSNIMIARNAVSASSSKYKLLDILTDIAGARLYSTLRDLNGLVYSAKGYITNYRDANYIAFTTAASTANTPKTAMIMMSTLREISRQISDAEVKKAVSYAINRHNMTFDRKEYIAGFIQDACFYGLTKESVRNYTEGLNSIMTYDINQVAKNYLNPDNLYMFVVGDPSLKPELQKIGTVYEYNSGLYAVEGVDARLEKVSLSFRELTDKYIKATGGRDRIASVKTMTDSSTVTMSIGGSVLNGTYVIHRQSPDMFQSQMLCGSFDLNIWSDGNKVWVRNNSVFSEVIASEMDRFYLTTKMFAYGRLQELGFKCSILGESNNMIMVEVVFRSGAKSTFFYDSDSYLLKKIETLENSPTPELVTEIYDDYAEFDGLMLPKVIETRTPTYKLRTEHTYRINMPLDPGVNFVPAND